MKVLLAVALLCAVVACEASEALRGARAAFRKGKRVFEDEMPEDVGTQADEGGNENVEIISSPKTSEDKPGCEGVDCKTRFDDGGKFAAALHSARTEVGVIYDHESQEAPVVLTEGFCAKVLAAFEAKAEPYWNSDKQMCNVEREHVLAQCERKVEGFIDKVSALCPNSNLHDDAELVADFKKVTYVPTIPKEFASTEEEDDDEPCPLGQKPCKKLKYTEDGLPNADWAEYPNAPSDEVEAAAVRSQRQAVRDCGEEHSTGCEEAKAKAEAKGAAVVEKKKKTRL